MSLQLILEKKSSPTHFTRRNFHVLFRLQRITVAKSAESIFLCRHGERSCHRQIRKDNYPTSGAVHKITRVRIFQRRDVCSWKIASTCSRRNREREREKEHESNSKICQSIRLYTFPREKRRLFNERENVRSSNFLNSERQVRGGNAALGFATHVELLRREYS